MSWHEFLNMVAEEAGAEAAARIEERASVEFGGMNLYVRSTRKLTRQEIESVAPGRPQEAARKLGIHRATAYRILRQQSIIR
jgi:transcriptional regulator of acetoin/glycerol metabolism